MYIYYINCPPKALGPGGWIMGVFTIRKTRSTKQKKTKKIWKNTKFLISKKNDHGFFLADFGTTVTYPVLIIHPWPWVTKLVRRTPLDRIPAEIM